MRLLTLAQLLTLMWVSWSILRDEQMVLWLLRAYSLGAGLLALLHLLVPGVSTDYTGSGYAGPTGARETALSYNPNDLAGVMTIGAVMAIGVWVVDKRRRFLSPALMVVSTLLPAAVVVRTGSRGGMVAFLAGVAVFLLPIGTSQKRLRLIGFSALVVLAAMVQLATNPVALDRWTNTFEEGEMAGRDTIYATALEMISERPLLGWHPVTFQHELGAREGGLRERDAHNLFLHLLLEVGIVGTIPFLIGMMACLVSAWGARAGPLGLSPLALLVAVLTINMSGTWLAMKQLWIIFGFALASGWSRRRPNPKKQLVTLPAFR